MPENINKRIIEVDYNSLDVWKHFSSFNLQQKPRNLHIFICMKADKETYKHTCNDCVLTERMMTW